VEFEVDPEHGWIVADAGSRRALRGAGDNQDAPRGSARKPNAD
jgi:hypothetical protein